MMQRALYRWILRRDLAAMMLALQLGFPVVLGGLERK